AHARVNHAVRRVKIERRLVGGQGQVCFVVRLYGAHVLPVAVEQKRLHLMRLDASWEDLLAEVGGRGRRVQEMDHRLAGEEIDAHAGEKLPGTPHSGRCAPGRVDGGPPGLDPLDGRAPGLQLFARLRFLDKAGDATGVVEPDDAELGGLIGRDRQYADGDVGLALAVRLQQVAVVHAVKLI